MARPRKQDREARRKALSFYPTDDERASIETGARGAGMAVSRYVLHRVLAADGTRVRTIRRDEVIAALSAAARALEDIAGMSQDMPIPDGLALTVALLKVERQICRIGLPRSAGHDAIERDPGLGADEVPVTDPEASGTPPC
ncbi:plasmid mobilization protein [Defluviimonas salinarum]|uniref:Transposase n=1 Tax=Defluviimonas salinarum TaxID=2992147 RepID=A0ABT3JB25_9RHOB|nr:hypothetical protein [Defluviimonas salinarum]MCW3784758.1 hypothetical protein [Defluviimonas salinarum]